MRQKRENLDIALKEKRLGESITVRLPVLRTVTCFKLKGLASEKIGRLENDAAWRPVHGNAIAGIC